MHMAQRWEASPYSTAALSLKKTIGNCRQSGSWTPLQAASAKGSPRVDPDNVSTFTSSQGSQLFHVSLQNEYVAAQCTLDLWTKRVATIAVDIIWQVQTYRQTCIHTYMHTYMQMWSGSGAGPLNKWLSSSSNCCWRREASQDCIDSIITLCDSEMAEMYEVLEWIVNEQPKVSLDVKALKLRFWHVDPLLLVYAESNVYATLTTSVPDEVAGALPTQCGEVQQRAGVGFLDKRRCCNCSQTLFGKRLQRQWTCKV